MATAALNRHTPDEYLALERDAEFRSEYLDGRVVAMAGASPEHADVVLNVGSELRTRLRSRGCRVFVNDVRVRTAPGYLYPDVIATCAPALFLEVSPRTLINPGLIVEVLSDSTERRDRGDKFAAYRSVDSLTEYVLIDSRRMHVERYARRGDLWARSAMREPDAVLELSSVGCALSLREIYADVELPPP